QPQVLTPNLEVVTTGGVEGRREIVPHRVHALIAISREIAVAVEPEAGERDDWTVGRDPVAGLPVIGPRRQTGLIETIGCVSSSDLVQCSVADHLDKLTEDVRIVFFIARGGRGMGDAPWAEGLEQRRVRDLPHQTHLL